MEVLPVEAIEATVAGVEPSSTVVGTSELAGGLSSWMTRIEIQRTDGSRHELIVRRGRRPDADRNTLAFGVEFALLEHLEARGIQVARPRAFDDTGRIMPQAYVVLDFVPGTTGFITDDPIGTALRMADVLAAVHGVGATPESVSALPLHAERMQGWVITRAPRHHPRDSRPSVICPEISGRGVAAHRDGIRAPIASAMSRSRISAALR